MEEQKRKLLAQKWLEIAEQDYKLRCCNGFGRAFENGTRDSRIGKYLWNDSQRCFCGR